MESRGLIIDSGLGCALYYGSLPEQPQMNVWPRLEFAVLAFCSTLVSVCQKKQVFVLPLLIIGGILLIVHSGFI